jgi:hypothetical protein
VLHASQAKLYDDDFDYGVKEQGWEDFVDFSGPKNWNVRTARSNPRTPVLDPDFEYNRTCKYFDSKTYQ